MISVPIKRIAVIGAPGAAQRAARSARIGSVFLTRSTGWLLGQLRRGVEVGMHVDERILVVDSDIATRARLQSMLTAHGYTVVQADGLAAAPAALGQAAWVFVIVGYQLDDGSGLDLLDVAQ